MKLPSPDHPIAIAPAKGRVVVRFGGETVADTTAALELREASYPAVLYIPRRDARLEHYARTAHTTHCPYKGDASYFTLTAGTAKAENAVWSYETPFPAMAAIKDHLAFYPQHVAIER
ncbi:MAG TPA: DUF427 domain-containing protein [Rhizomicrobium sp.]|jgi:uncharacterized protein (DUF427 family)|nr:DUF427 domain-containing protein [Rhizomicrobium sp.]